jgi:hypothetical protein
MVGFVRKGRSWRALIMLLTPYVLAACSGSNDGAGTTDTTATDRPVEQRSVDPSGSEDEPTSSSTTAPQSRQDELAAMVGGAQLANHVTYEFADDLGYTFKGELTFAIGNVRKDVTNASPGTANLLYDYAVAAQLTNTTPGRNTTIEGVGNVFILLPHDPQMGLCYGGDGQPTVLGTPFCVSGLGASSGPPSLPGTPAEPDLPVSAESGLVSDRVAGSADDEHAVDLAVDALSSGQIAGVEVTVETSSTSGQRLVYDAEGRLVTTCVIGDFDSFAELCAL